MSALTSLEDYRRYGRQMILDEFGLPGQLKLQEASVVVVGAGGLGCPALQYLGAAGIGRLGIVDHDTVELSNLQRQILHNEDTLGMPKAESATMALKRINSRLIIDTIIQPLTASHANELLAPYDIILDCTDNAPTRYLLSDKAVELGKPLVSGAAQKLEGQLCVYNFGPEGPCYRCLFPVPPAPENVGSCEEVGVLGVVTGIIGNLQALEAIKIIVGLADERPSMLIFSALGIPPFRSIKLRKKKPTCIACGVEGRRTGTMRDQDYLQFCGGSKPDWESRGLVEGNEKHRIGVKEFSDAIQRTQANVIDVRPKTEYGICHLPESKHISLNDIVARPGAYLPADQETPTYVVCRLGNDSQIAADALRSIKPEVIVKDVIGGLRAWSREVDPSFPVY